MLARPSDKSKTTETILRELSASVTDFKRLIDLNRVKPLYVETRDGWSGLVQTGSFLFVESFIDIAQP